MKFNLSRLCPNNNRSNHKQQHHPLVGLLNARFEIHPICFFGGAFHQNIKVRYDECLFPDEWYSWIPFNWWLLSPQAMILANDAEKSNNIICLFYRKPKQPVLIINAFWFCVFITVSYRISWYTIYIVNWPAFSEWRSWNEMWEHIWLITMRYYRGVIFNERRKLF